MNLVRQQSGQVQSKKFTGPTLFEISYLDQLQKELSTFLASKHLSTLEAIVVGVKGKDYQLLIPVNIPVNGSGVA